MIDNLVILATFAAVALLFFAIRAVLMERRELARPSQPLLRHRAASLRRR